MRVFFALAGFHARQLLRVPFFMQTAVLAPVSFLLLRGLGAMNVGTPLAPLTWLDASTAGVWATTTTAAGLIMYQRFQGTLEAHVLSVHRPGVVFGALTASAALIGLVGIPFAMLAQFVISHELELTIESTIGVLVALIACIGSAALLSSLFVVNPSASALEPLILVPVWMLVGIVVPFAELPAWLAPVALVHPLTSAVLAGHAESVGAAAAWGGLSVAVSGAWVVLAGVGLRAAITRARVNGTLAVS